MSNAHLRITNGGTGAGDFVDLIRGPFYLISSAPGMPAYKGGGVFIDSPLSSGRRIAYSVFDNPVDRYDLMLKSSSGDSSDDKLAVLLRLLEQAASHWKTNGRVSPVWIESRGPQHTNIQYARIVAGSIQGLANKFAQPYLQSGCVVIENELILLLERRNWKSVAPGSVESLSAQENEYNLNVVRDGSLDNYRKTEFWALLGSPDSTARSKAQVYSGEYSVHIIDTGSNGGIYQDVSELEVGSSVIVRAMAYVYSGTARLQIYDGGGTSNGVTNTTAVADQWVELSVTKTVPGSGSIRIALEAVGSSADIFVDDVSVYKTFGKAGGGTTDKVYFSNGRGDSHITHIFVLDQPSTYSSNLLETSLPYNLLPSTPVAGDILYLGSTDGHAGGGLFGNVVINLTSTATDITLVWEYRSGGAWVAFGMADPSDEFSISGEHVIGFSVPKEAQMYSVNSVSAMWIRARVTAVGTAGTVTQATFHPYAVTQPYVEIDGANVTGDSDPEVRLTIQTESSPVNDASRNYLVSGDDDGDLDSAGAATLTLTNTTVNMGQDHTICVRFDNVAVPQGAKITRATLQAVSGGGTSDGNAVYGIYIEKADDAAAFSGGEAALSTRTWSTEKVLWPTDPYWWNLFTGYAHDAPPIEELVQLVVDRAGWASGNAIAIQVSDDVVASAKYRTFSMYEDTGGLFGDGTLNWKLDVEYIDTEGYTSEMIIGARSTNRGADFQSNINLSPRQTNAITVEATQNSQFSPAWSSLGGPLFGLDELTIYASDSSGGTLVDRAIVTIPRPISASYSGKFRAFVRVVSSALVTTPDPISLRLRLEVGGQSTYGPANAIATLEFPELVDMGTVVIPELSSSDGDTIVVAIQASRGTSLIFQLTDLILIPSDEWIAEVRSPKNVRGVLESGRSLVINSIDTTSGLETELVFGPSRIKWSSSGPPLQLGVGNTIRLWAVSSTDQGIEPGGQASQRASFSNFVHSMQLAYIREFIIGRGTS